MKKAANGTYVHEGILRETRNVVQKVQGVLQQLPPNTNPDAIMDGLLQAEIFLALQYTRDRSLILKKFEVLVDHHLNMRNTPTHWN